jgi:hypothetical protein
VELVEGAGDGDGAILPVQIRGQLTKKCSALPDSEFVNLLRSLGIDFQPGGKGLKIRTLVRILSLLRLRGRRYCKVK